MKLPVLPETGTKTKRQLLAFGGIHYGQNFAEGELSESENLSFRKFPAISQRKPRKTLLGYNRVSALYARDFLLAVSGEDLLYDGEKMGKVSPGTKQFATINTKTVIFPDKVYFDLEKRKLFPMEARFPCYPCEAKFTKDSIRIPNRIYSAVKVSEGIFYQLGSSDEISSYESIQVGADGNIQLLNRKGTMVSQFYEGAFFRKDCGENEVMIVLDTDRNDSGAQNIRYELRKALAAEEAPLGETFSPGDTIEISGCVKNPSNNGFHRIQAIETTALGEEILKFEGEIFEEGTEPGEILLLRKIPDFTHICEFDNRIWGVSGNTIYGSALGDPTNFFTYQALSTDSYAAAVGTPGEFTGCIAHSSTVLFFKEDCVHKLLGNTPSTYEIRTYTWPGVQKGSEKSLAIINETLFYKGREGIYSYGGGNPVLLSSNFGELRFFSAAGGHDGDSYYISMADEEGRWGLYVYDTRRGSWLREDETQGEDFVFLNGSLYFIDREKGTVLQCGGEDAEEVFPWAAVFCPFEEKTMGKKQFRRMKIRAEIGEGAWFLAEVQKDEGPFQRVYSAHRSRTFTADIPIGPFLCDRFRLRISGRGSCRILSLSWEFEERG